MQPVDRAKFKVVKAVVTVDDFNQSNELSTPSLIGYKRKHKSRQEEPALTLPDHHDNPVLNSVSDSVSIEFSKSHMRRHAKKVSFDNLNNNLNREVGG